MLNSFGVPLSVGPHRDVSVENLQGGGFEISIEGQTPHFWSGEVPKAFDPKEHGVLAFEYFSPSGLEAISVRLKQKDNSMRLVGSAEVPLAETWQPFFILLSDLGDPAEEARFHFSLDGEIGEKLRIRKLEVRAANPDEAAKRTAQEAEFSAREEDADSYLQYLRGWYPNRISSVTVGTTEVRVKGHASTPLNLAELRAHEPSHSRAATVAAVDLSGDFELTFSRLASGGGYDRALSRWRLDAPGGKPASLARWPDEVNQGVARDLEEMKSSTVKGVGGVPDISSGDHQIFELGLGHATVNIVLDALVSAKKKAGFKPFGFEGVQYFFNPRFLTQKSETVRHLNEKNIVVTGILLVGNRAESGMAHPDAKARGVYSIPNLATEDGSDLYRAAVHFLTNHFSRPETRVANWVIHNEIDQAGTWTNMGHQPLARYLETYMRSARIVHHTARVFDPHARVFVSLTHHWTKPGNGKDVYTVRDVVDLFAEMAEAEGDFEWGIAYHPYPESLRNPDTWADERPTMDFDTPYITPKNMEVLTAYLAQERFRFKGEDRAILFSEQGFNTPTLSVEDQKRQVAAMFYTFRKLRDMPTVEAFHYHRYQDIPEREGGLQMGLLDKDGKRKLGWDVFAAIGTEAESEFESVAEPILRDIQVEAKVKECERPNIILILADDLGWSDTTPYQDPEEDFYETPEIAALAKRGMRFTHAYSASPLCSPTRASILNGQYPGRIRLTTPACHIPQVVLNPGIMEKAPPTSPVVEPETRTRFPNFYVTIPEILKGGGYQSAFVGKWHLGRAPYFPDQQGFDLVIGGREHPGPPGGFFAPWPIDTIPESPAGSHIDDVITTESIKWMREKVGNDEPFFLNLWYYSVHSPFQAKPELIEKFRKKAEALPENAPRKNPVMAAMIETMDTNIGRIVKALEELGVSEDTLIVFTSDNGGNEYNYTAGELATENYPLANGKGNIKDGGHRVPFIASWPGRIPEDTVNAGLVSSVDLFPTILEVAGQHPAPEQPVDGLSLLPVFLGKDEIDPDRSIFCHFPHSPPATGTRAGTSVQRGRYKLTRYYADAPGQKNRFVLVDTVNDPGELRNLAAENRDLVVELDREIGEHLRKTKALVPRPNPKFDGSILGWTFQNVSKAAREGGKLSIQASSPDPQMKTSDFPRATGKLSITIDMKTIEGSEATAYWSTDTNPGINKERQVSFKPISGKLQADLEIGKDRLQSIRIDPVDKKGEFAVRSIRLIEWKSEGEGKTVRLWEF